MMYVVGRGPINTAPVGMYDVVDWVLFLLIVRSVNACVGHRASKRTYSVGAGEMHGRLG